ncbi:transporter substrate-binding domain-containing protein [Microbulbifer elongatus]|uniref:Transporter substrate-binding domain-containing protein n=1 Tax=Microbulbifer elongatus TaxID=86173 RepID=A0ABT1NXU4_9GAMM|nr:transporter substrate-binding domain-containing protein [Microbulbifer elongatus]MCQ3828701.1 transporter substrate-binding domain-containing protein [Microbulbifer elongatus]
MGNSHNSARFAALTLFISTILILLVTACDRGAVERHQPPREPPVNASATAAQGIPPYIETGDLAAIRDRGVIRFVNLGGSELDLLPRDSIVTLKHITLANKLAEKLKLEARWIEARTPQEAIEMVQAGKADIAAYSLTDTEARRQLVDFTVPLLQSRQKLVTSLDGPGIGDPEQLRDVELIAQTGSVYIQTAKRLIAQNPDANLSIKQAVVYEDRDALVDLLKEKKNRVAILDDYIADNMLSYRKDIRVGAAVSESENIAWAVRKDSKQLLTRVNNYLTRNLVKAPDERISDWKAIKQSGVIRFLTYNRPSVYYLWKGVLMGFDYDLAKAFAEKHDLQLQVIVVPYDETLIDWLKAGKGDFAGALKNITQERIDQGVTFTHSYRETPEQVVSNRNKPEIKQIQDLAGRTLTVRANSPFIATARTLKRSGIDVEVEVAPAEISIAELVDRIAEGELDATIVDNDDAMMAASLRPELSPGTLVSDPRPQGWMVMPQNKQLLKKLDVFLAKYRKSEAYPTKVAAYFEPNKRFTQHVAARVIPGKDLSPYDTLVKRSSLEYGFDWRLVVAQMWQESNFNPKAVSPVGAQGLLQVMPATAEDMGFPPPLFEPDRNIQAGLKYLNWVRDRFEPTLPAVERLWFILASYNAGYGHLLDARRLARELGLNPDVWFGNVEQAMLKLSEPQYFTKARYGYVRGAEPVQYVRKISHLYHAYTDVASGDTELNQVQHRLSPTHQVSPHPVSQ